MRIVLDSNVLFSAYNSRGLCADLVGLCLEQQRVFISGEILGELEINLKKRSKAAKAVVEEALRALRTEGSLAQPVDVEPRATRDPDDLHVLGLAIAVKADLIVTGDQDLLVLKIFKGVPILSPREAWLKLRMI